MNINLNLVEANLNLVEVSKMICFDINLLKRRWSYGFDINIGTSSEASSLNI